MGRKSSQMQRLRMGVMLGIVAGLLSGILVMGLHYGMKEQLSIFVLWISCGIIIAHTKLKIKGAFKGIVLGLLLFIPFAILMAWGTWQMIPIIGVNTIFAALVGGIIKKYAK